MESNGWLELLDIPMLTFADVGMSKDACDRKVWRYAQEHQLILLTANRNDDGEDSLEKTIREENTAFSLPVLTVGDSSRVIKENACRQQCAERLVEIVLNIENYLGVGRIYLP